MTTPELTWTAPDPGHWQWAASHVPHALTPIYAELHIRAFWLGSELVYRRYGVPLAGNREVLINGRLYMAPQPLLGKPGAAPPPAPLLWLATRLHPELRRRARTAARALEQRAWRQRTDEWHAELRPALRRTNLGFQADDLASVDGATLADHVRRLRDHVEASHVLHFDLHGDDMGPLGMFLAACRDWGIAPVDALPALAGHSPSTTAAAAALRKVAVAVEAVGMPSPGERPVTLDGLRALGPGVAEALDEYLEEFGWRVVTGYDLDAKAVIELPEVLLANVWSLPPEDADGPLAAAGDAAATRLRERLPASERTRFDEVLGEARVALDLRDDNGPMTVEWPVGLLRRALLELGRRAQADGRLAEVEHAIELTIDEATELAEGRPGPGAEAVAARAIERAELGRVPAPPTIGERPAPPPLHLFPASIAAVTDMAMTCLEHLETPAPGAGGSGLRGLGVGQAPVSGTARVARSADEALARLEPGDVLVVPFTNPVYNAVLPIAGGLVTEEGGALSHAAVLARELGLPAVIGVAGALQGIPDGAQITLHPATGEVTIG